MIPAIRGTMGRERERTRRLGSSPERMSGATAGGAHGARGGSPAVPASLEEAVATRRQATTLLDALCAERARFEARLSSSRPDPVSARAGRGAIDGAINRTRSIVASLDRLLRASGGMA